MDSNDGGPVNIDKIVINNQTTETPFKSSPLKTYSKKSPDSLEAKSRYGRTHKRNFNSDFLSTDKHLGNYFNAEHVSRKYFFLSNSKDSHSMSPSKYKPKLTPNGKKRGRPRKSLPADMKLGENSQMMIQSPQKMDSSFQGQTDFQAPVPTSTETLPLPVELDRPAPAMAAIVPSEPVEECHDADWNVGDLCWAYIDGWPYWPGVVTRDPTNDNFRKTKLFGRSQTPCVMLHVTFFGDNGLRSWVKINRIMTFSGLDDYQTLVSDFFGPEGKDKDPSLARMYIVTSGRMKKWQAAVSEAESLLSETRVERVKYLQNLYSSAAHKPGVSAQPAAPSPRGRKRKIEDSNTKLSIGASVESSPSAPPPPKRKTVYTPVKVVHSEAVKISDDTSTAQPVTMTPLTVIPADKVPSSVKPILLKGRLPGIGGGSAVVIKEEPEAGPSSVKTLIVEDGKQTYKVKLMRATDVSPEVLASVIKPNPGPPITPRAIYRNDEPSAKLTPKAGDDSPLQKPRRGRPKKSQSSPAPAPTPKRPVESTSSSEKQLRTRTPKKPRTLNNDAEKAVSPASVLSQPEPKVTTASKKAGKKAVKKLPSKSFEAYCEQHFERATDENPDLSEAEIYKYLEKRWSQMTADAKAKFKSRLGDDSDCSDDVSFAINDNEEKAPLATPTIKTFRRAHHLFSGIKNDKVCQVCLLGSETGEEVLKCRGPCCGVFHASCGESRTPRTAFSPSSSTHHESSPLKKKISKHGKHSTGEIASTVLNTPPSSQGSPVSKVENAKINGAVISKTPKNSKTANNQKVTSGSNADSTAKTENESSKTADTLDSKAVTDDNAKKDLLSSVKEDTKSSKDSLASEDSSKISSEEDAKSDGSSKVPKSRKNNRKKSDDKDSSENSKEPKWMCGLCTKNKEDPCFICFEFTAESTFKCSLASCGKLYHESCQNEWPQHQKNGEKAFVCPQHACHTCISDDPRANLPKFAGDKLVRCIHCPTSFHYNNWCVPAGTNLLSLSQIICPRHYKGTSKHVNTSWCQICSIGGSLICCDDCPNSFHPECLKITTPQGKFICEDCETGRYPLYGEVVWVKLGAYRWWPARILFPSEIPDNICKLKHEAGMFVVKFFGSHDHYWVNRGKTFLYHEGDGEQVKGRSHLDSLFNLAMKEAAIAFENQERERNEREAGASLNHKPPRYARISVSKLIGKVKPPYSDEVPNRCECTVDMENPCGENSDCINRMLYVECSPDVCPAKDKCQNQKFEKRQYPPLVPFKTNNRGWGLKVLVPLKKGDFVIEYVGEIIDTAEYHRRLDAKQKSKDSNYYFLNIDKDTMIDAGPKGNKGRFINHSCSPNCETQKWTVNGITRIGIFAIQDIPKDSELVFNYKLETIGDALVECKCGSPKCIGFIGGKGQGKNNGGDKKPVVDGPSRAPRVRSRGGARPRIQRTRIAVEKVTEDTCFTCGEGGELLLCDSASCPKGYHLKCLGLTKQPPGGWVCPWHQCSVCSASKVQRCALCINSYCSQHAEGNISLHPLRGVLICFNHVLDSESGSESDIDAKLKTADHPAAPNVPRELKISGKVEKNKPGSADGVPKEQSKLLPVSSGKNSSESPQLGCRLSRAKMSALLSPKIENKNTTTGTKDVSCVETLVNTQVDSAMSTTVSDLAQNIELKSPEDIEASKKSLQTSKDENKGLMEIKSPEPKSEKSLRSRRSDSKIANNENLLQTNLPEVSETVDPEIPNLLSSVQELVSDPAKPADSAVQKSKLDETVGKSVRSSRSTRSTPQKLAVPEELVKDKKQNEASPSESPVSGNLKIPARALADFHSPEEIKGARQTRSLAKDKSEGLKQTFNVSDSHLEDTVSNSTEVRETRKSRSSTSKDTSVAKILDDKLSDKTPQKATRNSRSSSASSDGHSGDARSTRTTRSTQETAVVKEPLSESNPLSEEAKSRLESPDNNCEVIPQPCKSTENEMKIEAVDEESNKTQSTTDSESKSGSVSDIPVENDCRISTKSSLDTSNEAKTDALSNAATDVSKSNDVKPSKSNTLPNSKTSAAVTLPESSQDKPESEKPVEDPKVNQNEEVKTVIVSETDSTIVNEEDKCSMQIQGEPMDVDIPLENSKVDDSAKENELIQNLKSTPSRQKAKNSELKEPKMNPKPLHLLRSPSCDDKGKAIKTETEGHMSVKKVIRSYSRSPRRSEPKSEPLPVVVSVPPPELTSMDMETESSPPQDGQLNIKDMIVVFADTPEAMVTDSEAVTVNGH